MLFVCNSIKKVDIYNKLKNEINEIILEIIVLYIDNSQNNYNT